MASGSVTVLHVLFLFMILTTLLIFLISAPVVQRKNDCKLNMVQVGKLFKLGWMFLYYSTREGEGECGIWWSRCYCFTIPTDLEFKQRQPEVERSQVTMSLKLGQGAYGEVSNWCKRCLAASCWYFLTLKLILLSSLSASPSPSSLPSPSFPPFLLFTPPSPPTSHPSSRSPPSFFSPPLPLQSWKGSWSGHTVVMKKLKTKGDVFKSGYMDSFPHEYLRLR